MNEADGLVTWFLYGNNTTNATATATNASLEVNLNAGLNEATRLAQTPAGLFLTAVLAGFVVLWLWNWQK